MNKLSDLVTKTRKDNDVRDLKDLSARLQQRAFSWQHEDYFLLKRVLPGLIADRDERVK